MRRRLTEVLVRSAGSCSVLSVLFVTLLWTIGHRSRALCTTVPSTRQMQPSQIGLVQSTNHMDCRSRPLLPPPTEFMIDVGRVVQSADPFDLSLLEALDSQIFDPVEDNQRVQDMQLDSVKRKRKKKMNKHKIKKLRRSNRMKTRKR